MIGASFEEGPQVDEMGHDPMTGFLLCFQVVDERDDEWSVNLCKTNGEMVCREKAREFTQRLHLRQAIPRTVNGQIVFHEGLGKLAEPWGRDGSKGQQVA